MEVANLLLRGEGQPKMFVHSMKWSCSRCCEKNLYSVLEM